MGKVNASGENHLWLKYRKELSLSGLVEGRIPVDLLRGVSRDLRATLAPSPRVTNTPDWA